MEGQAQGGDGQMGKAKDVMDGRMGPRRGRMDGRAQGGDGRTDRPTGALWGRGTQEAARPRCVEAELGDRGPALGWHPRSEDGQRQREALGGVEGGRRRREGGTGRREGRQTAV